LDFEITSELQYAGLYVDTVTFNFSINSSLVFTPALLGSVVTMEDDYRYFVIGYSKASENESLAVWQAYEPGDYTVTLLPCHPREQSEADGSDNWGGPPEVWTINGGPGDDQTANPSEYKYAAKNDEGEYDGLVETIVGDYKDNTSSKTSTREVTGIFHWLSKAECDMVRNSVGGNIFVYSYYWWLRTSSPNNNAYCVHYEWGSSTSGSALVNPNILSRASFRINMASSSFKAGTFIK
jgi:hypothetical protein